jgi:hypothetical protein
VNINYLAQAAGLHVVGSVTKVHGICIGADKLGHFFDQGWNFNEEAKKPGGKAQDVTNLGIEMEVGAFGLSATGVFSNADLAANRAGMQFYKDLEKSPGKLNFRIGTYIKADWNEQANPSFYESGVGRVVWSNLLTGRWAGTFTPQTNPAPIKTKLDLLATTTGTVSGSFELDAQVAAGTSKLVSIRNGNVTQKTADDRHAGERRFDRVRLGSGSDGRKRQTGIGRRADACRHARNCHFGDRQRNLQAQESMMRARLPFRRGNDQFALVWAQRPRK